MAHSGPRVARLALTAFLLFAIGLLSGSAAAKTKSFRAVRTTHRALIFAPSGVEPQRIGHAYVRYYRRVHAGDRRVHTRRASVSRRRVRRAVSSGSMLRVRRHSDGNKGTLKLRLTGGSGGADSGAAGDGAGAACTSGTASPTFHPGPCWRPYADTSPFNTPVPANAPPVPDSAALVANLNGGPGWRSFGDGDRHPSSPNLFFPDPGDTFTSLRATSYDFGVSGTNLQLQTGAQPSGGWGTDHDAQMAIAGLRSTATPLYQGGPSEYHGWHCSGRTSTTVTCENTGAERLDGDGIASGGMTAARFAGMAGLVRPEEFMAGHIDHALSVVVPCKGGTGNPNVFPADGNSGSVCPDPADAIPLGTHFQLDPDYAIPAGLPDWKVGMLRALQRYGGYASDTASSGSKAAVEFEGEGGYTYLGHPDPYLAWLKSQGIALEGSSPHQYGWLDLGAGWDHSRLRVVGVCAARGTC